MEEKNDVKLPSEPSIEEIAEPVTQDVKLEEKPEIVEETPTKPATQVPQNIPYERFREVNERAKILEEELTQLKESSISSEKLAEAYPDWEMMSENEKWIAKELTTLKEKQKWEEDLVKAKRIFPVLGEKEAEFKTYAYKYPKSVDIEVLAKSFLFDNKSENPIKDEPAKTGLEKPTGGTRQVPSPGMTLEDIKRLRENQPKLYEKMIRDGKFPKVLPEK